MYLEAGVQKHWSRLILLFHFVFILFFSGTFPFLFSLSVIVLHIFKYVFAYLIYSAYHTHKNGKPYAPRHWMVRKLSLNVKGGKYV